MRNLTRIISAILILAAATLFGSDEDFNRAWTAAQRAMPAQIHNVARIAPPNEPGRPLTIHGRVVLPDGRTAVANAVVFAWQTDDTGLYDVRGSAPHSWRLRGWARTDGKGRFTFHTIRPGAYPGGREAPHVHFSVETRGRRYFPDDLRLSPDDGRKRREREVVEIVLPLRRSAQF